MGLADLKKKLLPKRLVKPLLERNFIFLLQRQKVAFDVTKSDLEVCTVFSLLLLSMASLFVMS